MGFEGILPKFYLYDRVRGWKSDCVKLITDFFSPKAFQYVAVFSSEKATAQEMMVHSPFLFKRQSVQSVLYEKCLIVKQTQVNKPFDLSHYQQVRDYFEGSLGADCLE